jgi:hypothetical protein
MPTAWPAVNFSIGKKNPVPLVRTDAGLYSNLGVITIGVGIGGI